MSTVYEKYLNTPYEVLTQRTAAKDPRSWHEEALHSPDRVFQLAACSRESDVTIFKETASVHKINDCLLSLSQPVTTLFVFNDFSPNLQAIVTMNHGRCYFDT